MVIMNSSSKNKRKGHDESKVSLSRSVVVSPHTSSLSRSGMDCIGRLDSILNLCSSETDPLHDSMAEISTHRAKSFPQKVHTTLEKGDAILQKLQNNIATTNVQVQNESAAAAAKDEQLQKLVRHAECMMEQIATTEEQCDKLSDEIVHYQNLEDTETQVIQSAERKSSARVLRLKKQLALYGNMTGIKWHYAAQELDDRYLFGEVVRTKHNFRSDGVIV